MSTKDEWLRRGQQREAAFRSIAAALGKEHPVTRMLGPLAYGRHHWELGGNTPTLQQAIVRAAALDGYFQAINIWARDNDRTAQDKLLAIWHQRNGLL